MGVLIHTSQVSHIAQKEEGKGREERGEEGRKRKRRKRRHREGGGGRRKRRKRRQREDGEGCTDEVKGTLDLSMEASQAL
jgi:hypothetical protein